MIELKKVKKLFIAIILFIFLIFQYSIPSFATTPSITPEQQAYLATYVRTYIAEANKYNYVYYDTYHDTETSLNNEATSNGQIAFCCASFCNAMLYQALGAERLLEQDRNNEINLRVTGSFNPERNPSFNELTNEDILLPGDIITYSGYSIHSLIYIGCDPETGYHQVAENGNRIITLDQFPPNRPIRYRDFILQTKWGQVSRLDPSILEGEWEPKGYITWPGGRTTQVSGYLVLTNWEEEELWYNGIADLVYEGEAKTWLQLAIESLAEIANYLIGIIIYLFKMPIIAIAQIAETILNWILQIFTGSSTLQMITIEDIIFNRVPLLNINIFQPLAENTNINQTGLNVIQTLRDSITIWYYIFRYIVIIGMLLTLIYLGVRMAITTIAEDKAKYKKLLVDWLISFIIIFVIHYYIIFVVIGNDFLLGIFEDQIASQTNSGIMDDFDSSVIENTDNSNETQENTESILSTQSSLFNKIRDMAYSFKFTEGFLGTFAYIILVYYTIKFCIKYVKRMFNIYILIILAPLVALSYAFDKIKDGKSQSLSRWMKELGFGVLLQSLHALIYTIFVSIVIIQIQDTNMFSLAFSCVLMFITFNFMDKAEQLFEVIFGMKSDSIATATATLEGIATVKSTIGVVKGAGVVAGTAAKAVTTGVRKIPAVKKVENKIKDNWNQAKYGDNKKNKGNTSSIDNEINKEKENVKKQESKLKTERKTIRKEAMKAVGNLMATIPQLADNPTHGIALFIAGITGIKSTRRKIYTYRRKETKTYKADVYAKIKALNARRDAEINLKQEITNLINDENTIIGNGFRKDATQEERSKAVQILEEKIEEKLKGINQTDVEKAVNKVILNNKGEITQKSLDNIFEEIEKTSEKEEKTKIQEGTANEVKKEDLTEKQKKKKEFNEKVDETLVNMMTEQAFTKSEEKQSFTGHTALMIKQAKEKLQKQLEREAINSKMSKNETRQNLERGLRQELEAYVKKQQEKNAILRDIKKQDLTDIITLAMNSENSILTQIDNNKGIKNTSNENTNIGSSTGKPKVRSNVSMRKNKDKEEPKTDSTNINSRVNLKEIDAQERLKGELEPVLRATTQLRQADAELKRITRKDRRTKLDNIDNIIEELSRRKEEKE